MIRLFAAIALPPDLGRSLCRLCQGVRGARWRPTETLHLTLRFFGDVSEGTAGDLDRELATVATAPFDVTLADVGAFEACGAPNHLWAGVQANPKLDQLQRRCERAAGRAGLSADLRPWRPHVTLAHLSAPAADQVGAWIATHRHSRSPPFHVTSFSLYSSRREGGGHVYQLERDYRLKPRRDP